MNEKLIAFRVGVVVLAAACLAVGLIGIFGGGKGLLKPRYIVYLRFPTAPNVTVNTPVRKNGVLIGRVSNVELEDDHVLLTASIDSNRTLRSNEICRISTASLLGDAVLEFVPTNTKPGSSEIVQPGSLLADGVVATDPLQVLTNLEGDIRLALGTISGAAKDVSAVATNLNQTFGGDAQRIQRIMAKSEMALDSFQKAMTTMDDVIGDPQLKENLKQSLADLPKMFNDVQETLGRVQTTMESFDRVGRKAEQNLDNLAEFTGPLGEKGEQLMTDLGRSVQNLEEISSQLVIFSQSINSSDGTLGKFIHDRELYDDIRETVGNLHSASRRIEPILRDVRILTDKMSVDPGGQIKRALNPKPPGVGRKWSDAGIPFTPRR